MRHAVAGRKLNRTGSHRVALRRNLVQSLIEHGQIRTTLIKARDVRPFAEKIINLAVGGALADRQHALALLGDRSIVPAEHREEYNRLSDAKRAKTLRSRSGRRYRANTTRPGVKFTAESVIHRLFSEIGPRMRKRNEDRKCSGGYTRIIALADRRIGDGGQIGILQLVSEKDEPRAKGSAKTERKRRARVKYAFYAGKGLHRRGASRSSSKATVAEAVDKEAPEASAE